MRNRLIVSVVLLELVLAGTFGCLRYRAFQSAAHTPIVLGFIAPPVDPEPGDPSVEDRKAKQLAIDEINRAGGINGHPIEAAWEDGACDAKTGTSVAQKLLDRGAVAILTGPCTTETLAAAAVTQPARIPLIASTSPGKAVSFAGDLVYRLVASDATTGSSSNESNPAYQAFLSGFVENGSVPSDPIAAAHAYDSVYVLAEAIEQVGTDAQDIQAYLNHPGRTWETSFGTMSFDVNGDAVYPIRH